MKYLSFFFFFAFLNLSSSAQPLKKTQENRANLPSWEEIKKGAPEKHLKYLDCIKKKGEMVMSPNHYEKAICVRKGTGPSHVVM